MGGRLAIVSCLCLLAAAGMAQAAKNPQLTYLQTTLKKNMVAAFKKEAPGLTITKVTCKLPTGSGATAHCTAHFKANGGTGYYSVTTTLTKGKLKWTTTGNPVCFNAKGIKTSC